MAGVLIKDGAIKDERSTVEWMKDIPSWFNEKTYISD